PSWPPGPRSRRAQRYGSGPAAGESVRENAARKGIVGLTWDCAKWHTADPIPLGRHQAIPSGTKGVRAQPPALTTPESSCRLAAGLPAAFELRPTSKATGNGRFAVPGRPSVVEFSG